MFLDIAVKIFSWLTPDHENFTTRNIITRKFYNTKISQYTVHVQVGYMHPNVYIGGFMLVLTGVQNDSWQALQIMSRYLSWWESLIVFYNECHPPWLQVCTRVGQTNLSCRRKEEVVQQQERLIRWVSVVLCVYRYVRPGTHESPKAARRSMYDQERMSRQRRREGTCNCMEHHFRQVQTHTQSLYGLYSM